MAREENAIFTVLCMVYDDHGNILVENRKDPDWPGVCFPGGHVEHGESFTEAAIRETFEETGLAVSNLKLCGVKQFQTQKDARYVVFFYKTNQFSGTLQSSDEGEALWVPRSELLKQKLVRGFEEMLTVFESDEISEVFWNKGEED